MKRGEHQAVSENSFPALVPKLCLGTHGTEAPLRTETRTRAIGDQSAFEGIDAV
jgi:hypothetical protein